MRVEIRTTRHKSCTLFVHSYTPYFSPTGRPFLLLSDDLLGRTPTPDTLSDLVRLQLPSHQVRCLPFRFYFHLVTQGRCHSSRLLPLSNPYPSSFFPLVPRPRIQDVTIVISIPYNLMKVIRYTFVGVRFLFSLRLLTVGV